jgi:hypothetical protein
MLAGRILRSLQKLLGLQEEVLFLPGQLPLQKAVEKASTAVREMCLPEKIAVRIRRVESMETA